MKLRFLNKKKTEKTCNVGGAYVLLKRKYTFWYLNRIETTQYKRKTSRVSKVSENVYKQIIYILPYNMITLCKYYFQAVNEFMYKS